MECAFKGKLTVFLLFLWHVVTYYFHSLTSVIRLFLPLSFLSQLSLFVLFSFYLFLFRFFSHPLLLVIAELKQCLDKRCRGRSFRCWSGFHRFGLEITCPESRLIVFSFPFFIGSAFRLPLYCFRKAFFYLFSLSAWLMIFLSSIPICHQFSV